MYEAPSIVDFGTVEDVTLGVPAPAVDDAPIGTPAGSGSV